MTTNDATSRDAIAIEISEVAKADSDLHYATSGSMFLDNPEECADAVIEHLWREAMKPEVIAAMAKALWVADDKPGVGHGSDGYRMEAEHHIRLVLNLIIGPSPSEQETER